MTSSVLGLPIPEISEEAAALSNAEDEDDPSPLSYLTAESFWTYAIILPIVSAIGIVGNIINLVVLTKGEEFQVNLHIYNKPFLKILTVVNVKYSKGKIVYA